MEIVSTAFEDVKVIKGICFKDERGSFEKTLNKEEFMRLGLLADYEETFFSVSQKGVIRGMHFQMPPYAHEKLVHVIEGAAVDVIVDLRKESPSYQKHIAVLLFAGENQSIYIPKGFAHGFLALEDHTVMLYQTACGYHSESDCGIAYDSIGFHWGISSPVVSKRDRSFVRLEDFDSPF